jgi:formylmethanofuran dehydrogenase subunit E-like metal-binding protein
VALILALVPGLALADDASMEELGSRASKIAMDQLSFQKGDENVLALTDAGYVKAGDDTTQKALKGIIEATGCNIGDSNLFQVLRPHWKPLWFYFFNRASGEAVFVQTSAPGAQSVIG